MNKTITSTELSASAEDIVKSVREDSDCYVVSQNGKADVAIVPKFILDNYERNRKDLYELAERIAAANQMSEDEAMKLANEEVQAVRAARRAQSEAV